MKQELKARLARLGPIEAIARVRSGSPADTVLRPAGDVACVKTIDAINALIRRGVPGRKAMTTIDTMIERGEAVVDVPKVERGTAFADELAAAGVAVTRVSIDKEIDARSIRERLGLSVATFAKRYGLNPRTVEGWEQGRPVEPVARAYLHAIAANPAQIARSLEEPIT